jgi:exonuclease SbcD
LKEFGGYVTNYNYRDYFQKKDIKNILGGEFSLRLLHLADLHLGWVPGYLPEEKQKVRRWERDQLLEKAVDFALSPQGNIQAVLIVGDLFEDYCPEEPLVKHVMGQIHRLTKAGLLVVTVPGNHDEITYHDSVYRRYGEHWPGLLVRNPMPELLVSRQLNGTVLHIYSLAYTGGLTNLSALDTFPRTDVPGLHIGAFHGSLDWKGLPDRSLPLNSTQLAAAGYDYIALGHYHRYSEKKVGSAKAVYPGAVEFKSFSDPGSGCFTILEEKGGDLEIEKVPPAHLRHYQFHELEISSFTNLEEICETCRKLTDPEIMLHLTLSGTPRFSFQEEQLATALEADYFYIELQNKVHYFTDSFLENIAREPTVRGLFVRRLQEKQQAAATEREQKVLELALLKGLAALEGSGHGE